MKIYRVGGCVRDEILGLEPKDIDYVFVGATPQQLLALGYKQVGKDFPVFLDENNNECALARKERKIGPGYYGFETTFDTSITLEDDLRRRDLSINAIAFDVETKTYIDPFGGMKDLDVGVLRHVSDAFREDPVRILRTCRFAARYKFFIAPETVRLMTDMVESGEIDHLVPERVWLEMEKAIMEPAPDLFFRGLNICGAIKLFPYFSGIGKYQYMWDALALAHQEDLPAHHRFALLTLPLNNQDLHEFYRKWRAPIGTSIFAATFRQIFYELQGRDNISPKKAHSLFKELDLYRGKVLLHEIVLVIDRCFPKTQLAAVANQMVYLHNIATSIKFADLREDQKSSLRGNAITNAINELRLVRMSIPRSEDTK